MQIQFFTIYTVVQILWRTNEVKFCLIFNLYFPYILFLNPLMNPMAPPTRDSFHNQPFNLQLWTQRWEALTHLTKKKILNATWLWKIKKTPATSGTFFDKHTNYIGY